MLIDAFPAFDEIPLAEFRISYLEREVDLVVIGEAKLTQSGVEKELYFSKWLEENLKKFGSRVVVIEIPLKKTDTNWQREIQSREFIQNYLAVNYSKHKFILSDLDELPSRSQVRFLKENTGIYHFGTPTYYRKVNWKLRDAHSDWWLGVMGEVSLNEYPNGGRFSKEIPRLEFSDGAHFSWLGRDGDKLWKKSQAAAHEELSQNHWKSERLVQFCDLNRIDHLGRVRSRYFGLFSVVHSPENELTKLAAARFPNWVDNGENLPNILKRIWASTKVSAYVGSTAIGHYSRKIMTVEEFLFQHHILAYLLTVAELIIAFAFSCRRLLKSTVSSKRNLGK